MLDLSVARQLLAELEMVSHGTTQAFDTSGGHSSEKPLMPPGETNPPHTRLRAELAKALTQTQVDKVADKAREALRKARYTPPSDALLIYGTKPWREAIGNDDRPAAVVAADYKITERHVRRLRAVCRDKAA